MVVVKSTRYDNDYLFVDPIKNLNASRFLTANNKILVGSRIYSVDW